MWWSRFFCVASMPAMILAGAILSACSGGGDIYTDSQYRDLGRMEIKAGASRIDQIYRRRLDLLLARHSDNGGDNGNENANAAQDRYELTIGLNSVSTEDSVTMSARVSLYDREQGREVARRNLGSSASIGATASLYGAEEAKRFARERLAANLADKTYHYLIVHVSRAGSQTPPQSQTPAPSQSQNKGGGS